MTSESLKRRSGNAPAATSGRFSTGPKVFLILGGVLLPFALIALFASWQTTRTQDQELRARLRVAAVEASRSLAIELVGDATALRTALNALEQDISDAPGCARAQGVFAQQVAAGVRFTIREDDRVVCGTGTGPLPDSGNTAGARILPDTGLILTLTGTRGRAAATVMFPTEMLADIARPSGFVNSYGTELAAADDTTLILRGLDDAGPLDRRERIRVPLGLNDLSLIMTVHRAPITSPMVVAMLLPLLMWAAAALVAWFVVDRLLIRQLQRLRAGLDAYRPGEVLPPIDYGAVPAQEIQDLGNSFRDLTRTVQQHEAAMAEGLVRQTRLTREVHHRVKNNLQVIGSLINFHSRSAASEEASAAYASIQRRVDALAVVHRHHYAELEENRGLELRAVIGELASNIRATAPPASARMGITLDIAPLLASQDTAVAVSFLLTELIELATSVDPQAQIAVSARPSGQDGVATLRVSSLALRESDEFEALATNRYGRIILGLSRQLRAPLHHDPLVGAYEIAVAARLPD